MFDERQTEIVSVSKTWKIEARRDYHERRTSKETGESRTKAKRKFIEQSEPNPKLIQLVLSTWTLIELPSSKEKYCVIQVHVENVP